MPTPRRGILPGQPLAQARQDRAWPLDAISETQTVCNSTWSFPLGSALTFGEDAGGARLQSGSFVNNTSSVELVSAPNGPRDQMFLASWLPVNNPWS